MSDEQDAEDFATKANIAIQAEAVRLVGDPDGKVLGMVEWLLMRGAMVALKQIQMEPFLKGKDGEIER